MSKFNLHADNMILKKDREMIFMNLGEIMKQLECARNTHIVLSLRLETRTLELCLLQKYEGGEPELGILADHGTGMSIHDFQFHYRDFKSSYIPTFIGKTEDGETRRFGVHHIMELPWNDIRRPQFVLWSV